MYKSGVCYVVFDSSYTSCTHTPKKISKQRKSAQQVHAKSLWQIHPADSFPLSTLAFSPAQQKNISNPKTETNVDQHVMSRKCSRQEIETSLHQVLLMAKNRGSRDSGLHTPLLYIQLVTWLDKVWILFFVNIFKQLIF